MKRLAQTGIFKAQVLSWGVRKANSGAIAVNFEFLIRSELENDTWASWDDFDQHTVYGDWWVVKKDGTINQGAVDQLVQVLGWNGDLNSIIGDPPALIVQIAVKDEEYDGKTRYKAAWMNPEDYQPAGVGEAPAEVQVIQNRFGGLLRAAAAASAQKQGQAPTAPPPAAAAPRGPQPAKPSGPQHEDDMGDIPF